MGLIDLAPDILAGPIEYKLAFIHHLLRNNAKPVSPSLLNESSQRASQR
jgi:hypothetical protein